MRVPSNDHRGYFSAALPRVIAHRGLSLEAPENTKLSFLKALSLGVTHLETDVHASSDGVAVVSHDDDLKRVAGREVRVSQLTMAELRRVDLGDGQGFSSLAEVLDAFPEAYFNIDIKSADAVQPAIDAIRDAKATGRVLIASFDEKRRASVVAGLPGVATSASSGILKNVLLAVPLGNITLLRRALRGVHAVQIPERIAGVTLATARTVRLLHSAGVEVHVWTVNDSPDMRRLLDVGVDGIITDRSDIALTVIRERPTTRP